MPLLRADDLVVLVPLPGDEDDVARAREPDRRTAIALALGLARPGDLVLVAGKGHEDYQIVGTEKHHLDDREEVRRLLGSLA